MPAAFTAQSLLTARGIVTCEATAPTAWLTGLTCSLTRGCHAEDYELVGSNSSSDCAVFHGLPSDMGYMGIMLAHFSRKLAQDAYAPSVSRDVASWSKAKYSDEIRHSITRGYGATVSFNLRAYCLQVQAIKDVACPGKPQLSRGSLRISR